MFAPSVTFDHSGKKPKMGALRTYDGHTFFFLRRKWPPYPCKPLPSSGKQASWSGVREACGGRCLVLKGRHFKPRASPWENPATRPSPERATQKGCNDACAAISELGRPLAGQPTPLAVILLPPVCGKIPAMSRQSPIPLADVRLGARR